MIVSLVTEIADEVGKLLRKENSFREISQKEFSGVLRSKYHQIRCLSVLVGDVTPVAQRPHTLIQSFFQSLSLD